MYEIHNMKPSFPIFFHTDINSGISRPHWHENIEILHLIKGKGKIVIDSKEVFWAEGDTVIVNTNSIHQFFSVSSQTEYHCLIVDINFLKQLGIDLNNNYIRNKVNDKEIASLFSNIKMLSMEKPECYEPEMCCDALKIITLLMRKYLSEKQSDITFRNSAKYVLTQNAITYMKKNFALPVSLDDISKHLGFTKCYFCRTFKETTGLTAVQMINFFRCIEAKRLLLTTTLSVSEAAAKCGYTNLSYFSKKYKNIIGCMPSETKTYFSSDDT